MNFNVAVSEGGLFDVWGFDAVEFDGDEVPLVPGEALGTLPVGQEAVPAAGPAGEGGEAAGQGRHGGGDVEAQLG